MEIRNKWVATKLREIADDIYDSHYGFAGIIMMIEALLDELRREKKINKWFEKDDTTGKFKAKKMGRFKRS